MNKPLLRALTELSSRKWISRITGGFAQSTLSRHLIPRFAKIYGIPVEEAEKELAQYRTLNEFFTRRLKPGKRIIHSGPRSVISPVDALITGAGDIQAGTILNVKGQNYSIDELLGGSKRADHYRNGYYMVLYLSPSDYHRIHSPISGDVMERVHLPGKVYPVNDFGLRHMPRVLSRNERLITYIRHQGGEAAVVKVGAMNVSSIQYVQQDSDKLTKGEELAYFQFGSTVVLLLEDGTFMPGEGIRTGARVKMGDPLGELI
ncbi:phosphatidylserine decarboxylase [Paenibacillus oryzae]|uniref:Phosphatidylserine decarboxylase proenzyme n=1 Tax=Paenibacillus oryzae TaxID=1844972 RepID=A0A1A5YBG2_9BACL|nr:archaetidylserine decarboxylase [Paenibacillus oryzae]OBR62941.1 phosphatidylserine decarboxylase [Paenibacillus oryzae]